MTYSFASIDCTGTGSSLPAIEACSNPVPVQGSILEAINALASCVCAESLAIPVKDSGLKLIPDVNASVLSYKIPPDCRDISIYNGTAAIARFTLPTGFCFVPPNGTQVLTNTLKEPHLDPFTGGTYRIGFDRPPGPNSFIIVNFRTF